MSEFQHLLIALVVQAVVGLATGNVWDVHSWFWNLTLPVLAVLVVGVIGSERA